MAKIRTIDAFMDGKVFVRVKTKECIDSLMRQLLEEDCEAMNKIDAAYKKDFGINAYNSGYYLTYYKKQHALKAMCSEFFEKVYNSGSRSPYIVEM